MQLVLGKVKFWKSKTMMMILNSWTSTIRMRAEREEIWLRLTNDSYPKVAKLLFFVTASFQHMHLVVNSVASALLADKRRDFTNNFEMRFII